MSRWWWPLLLLLTAKKGYFMSFFGLLTTTHIEFIFSENTDSFIFSRRLCVQLRKRQAKVAFERRQICYGKHLYFFMLML